MTANCCCHLAKVWQGSVVQWLKHWAMETESMGLNSSSICWLFLSFSLSFSPHCVHSLSQCLLSCASTWSQGEAKREESQKNPCSTICEVYTDIRVRCRTFLGYKKSGAVMSKGALLRSYEVQGCNNMPGALL